MLLFFPSTKSLKTIKNILCSIKSCFYLINKTLSGNEKGADVKTERSAQNRQMTSLWYQLTTLCLSSVMVFILTNNSLQTSRMKHETKHASARPLSSPSCLHSENTAQTDSSFRTLPWRRNNYSNNKCNRRLRVPRFVWSGRIVLLLTQQYLRLFYCVAKL